MYITEWFNHGKKKIAPVLFVHACANLRGKRIVIDVITAL